MIVATVCQYVDDKLLDDRVPVVLYTRGSLQDSGDREA